MPLCSVPGCFNSGVHLFPKNSALKKKWETSIRRKNFIATQHSRLCRSHFKESDYVGVSAYTGQPQLCRFLKKGTVPSIFPWSTQVSTTPSSRALRHLERSRSQIDFSQPPVTVEEVIPEPATSIEIEIAASDSLPDSINRKPVQNASPVGDSLQASSSGKEVLRHEEPKPNSSTLKCDSPPVDDLDDNTSVAAEGALEDYTSADDTGPVQFSWQNSEQISIDEDGDCVPDDAPPTVPTLEMIVENVSKQDVEADINIKPEKHTEYFCDCCSKEIIGFRYTCVQCDNFDLCCSCESKLLHPHHYMLRVPGHKPFSEVNSILEAIREKIKLLTEEAQNSEGLQLDEIKLEEPQFEEVTVDPFSEVTIPVADDHTTQLQAHTSENKSDTTHTIETKASDMQKEPKIDQPKAPMKIAIRKDVFFKAYKKKTAGEKTIVQLKAIEMQAKNIAPIILQKQRSVVVPQLLNCRVGLSRLKTTQVETHPSTSSQGSASKTTVKQKSLGVKDLDSEARIARENLEENDQEVEMQISRNEKFTSIVKKKQDEATRTQSEEFLDEVWLDDI